MGPAWPLDAIELSRRLLIQRDPPSASQWLLPAGRTWIDDMRSDLAARTVPWTGHAAHWLQAPVNSVGTAGHWTQALINSAGPIVRQMGAIARWTVVGVRWTQVLSELDRALSNLAGPIVRWTKGPAKLDTAFFWHCGGI